MEPQVSYFGTREAVWIEVRNPRTHKLLFRYEPNRQLVEIGQRGDFVLVDLCAEREKFFSGFTPSERP
jgi:hypothetical protein